MDLLEQAQKAGELAKALGADEFSIALSRASESSLVRRAGKLEQATASTSMGIAFSLLVDDRYSAHSTSDLRPDALRAFVERAIAATRELEPEPERRLAPPELCGRSASDAELDCLDPSWEDWTATDRRAHAEALEAAVEALPGRSQILSATSYVSDSQGETARVMSNGFAQLHRAGGFGHGVDVTLSEPDGRRPEAMSWYSAIYRASLPSVEEVAKEAFKKAERRLGAGPCATGRYPMVLDAPSVGRILGVLGGPLAGSELHQKRSCLADKLGQKIASSVLSITDDPSIPRGLGSRPYDGDGFPAKKMEVLKEGVLQNYYISLYYSRKLGVAPTTGGRSNWVVAPGARSQAEILASFPTCILVNGFLGGNSNGQTGDFSFGIQGHLVQNGEIVQNLSEMNVSGNILELLPRLVEVGSDVWTWGGLRSGSLVFEDVDFSGL